MLKTLKSLQTKQLPCIKKNVLG